MPSRDPEVAVPSPTATRHNVVAAWAWRFTSIAVNILILRLLSLHLTTLELAFLIFLQGISLLIAFADFGLTNAILMSVPKRRARNGSQGCWASVLMPHVVRRHLKFGASWLVLGVIVCHFFWIPRGLGAVAVFGPFFAHATLALLNSALSVPAKAQLFEGQGYVQYWLGCLSSLVNLALLYAFAGRLEGGELLIAAVLVDGSCVLAANLIVIHVSRALLFRGERWSVAEVESALALSRKNLYIMSASAIILNTDFLLLGALPPEQLVQYGLMQRLFGAAYNAHNSALASLWPNFAASAKGPDRAPLRLATRCAAASVLGVSVVAAAAAMFPGKSSRS